MAYGLVLGVHNIVRWLVLIAAVFAIVRGFRGWSGRHEWAAMDHRAGLWFTISFDVQFLLGLTLYFFLSPYTTAAFADFGAAMGMSVSRYWLVEHTMMMVIGLILAHVGRARSKKAATPVSRHRNAALFYLLSLLVVLAAVPWPFSRISRPLLPF